MVANQGGAATRVRCMSACASASARAVCVGSSASVVALAICTPARGSCGASTAVGLGAKKSANCVRWQMFTV